MFKVKNLISHHNYVVFLLKRLQIQMGAYLGFGTDLEFCFDLQCLKIQVHFNIPVKTRLPPEMSPDDLTGSHLLRIRLPLSASAQTSSSLRVRWRGVKCVWPDLTPAVSSIAPQHCWESCRLRKWPVCYLPRERDVITPSIFLWVCFPSLRLANALLRALVTARSHAILWLACEWNLW